MSNSKAKPADLAAKAGAISSSPAAIVEASNDSQDTAQAETTGEAAVKSPEKAPETSEKQAETVAKVVEMAAETIETVVKEGAKPENVGDTKKIKMLRSHPAFSYNPGEEGELLTENAEKLVADGFAQFVSADGEVVASNKPTKVQLANAQSAYERFVAVADAETDGEAQQLSPAFADLPHPMQCAFVAAIDPAYNHKAA